MTDTFTPRTPSNAPDTEGEKRSSRGGTCEWRKRNRRGTRGKERERKVFISTGTSSLRGNRIIRGSRRIINLKGMKVDYGEYEIPSLVKIDRGTMIYFFRKSD